MIEITTRADAKAHPHERTSPCRPGRAVSRVFVMVKLKRIPAQLAEELRRDRNSKRYREGRVVGFLYLPYALTDREIIALKKGKQLT